MSAEPSVRYATREDVPTILALIYELADYENASSSVEATEETLLNTLTFSPSPSDLPPAAAPGYARTLLLTAQPENEIVGMALYFNNYSTWRSAPGVYLEDLYVRERYRKRGYGKRLIQELAKETLRIGGARLEWSCLNWNKPSLEFYSMLGAKRQNEWVVLRMDGDDLKRLAEGHVEK